MRMARKAFMGGSEYYESPSFRAAVSELLGEGAARAVDGLLRNDAFPSVYVPGPGPSVDMIAHEAALIIAATAAEKARFPSFPDAARAILALEYQVEYGPEAIGDRKGHREGNPGPQKNFFGSQLARALRSIGKSPDRLASVAVTIGWSESRTCFALIHYGAPQTEVTLVYAYEYLFPNLRPGIVRLTHLEFDLPVAFHIDTETMSRFVRLMNGADALSPDGGTD